MWEVKVGRDRLGRDGEGRVMETRRGEMEAWKEKKGGLEREGGQGR